MIFIVFEVFQERESKAGVYLVFEVSQTRVAPRFVTKIHADLVLQACIAFLGCFFRTPGTPMRKILVCAGPLPVLSVNGLNLCKLVSRSDLPLDADHSLNFVGYHKKPISRTFRGISRET